MTVNKLTYPAKENAVQEKINEIIDNLGASITVDQTYDGTSSNPQSGVAIAGELSTNYQPKLVSGTNIKTINNTSLLGSENISVLQNTATGTGSLGILGGTGTASYAIAIGFDAYAPENGSIQLGYGANSTAKSLSVGFYDSNNPTNYQLLDGTTGLIPDARISSNIARTSAIPTQASDISAADTTLSNVSSIDSNSAVQTALNGKADTSLSNLSATGKTVIDGQWVNSYLSIASGESGTSSYSKDFSLSSYLPNDGKSYEVLLCCGGRTGTTSGNSIQIWLGSDIMAVTLTAYGVTRTSNYFVTGGAVTLPVGTSRKITLALTSSGGTCSNVWVQAKGYRRIGTNG